MAEWDELRAKLLGLEEEKRKFEEHYDLLAGEKACGGTCCELGRVSGAVGKESGDFGKGERVRKSR